MIIIPARLASTRFKNKILKEINGVPMFIATAKNCQKADNILIAVDDESTLKIAQNYGFDAVLTSTNHQSGSDRINEAIDKFKLRDDEVIMNVQADEPFFESENLLNFKKFATNAILKEGKFMASCYKIASENDAKDPNLVKVVTTQNGDALYFSRSLIPYPRNKYSGYKAHIGIYAYSQKSLSEFCKFNESELEKTEKLEQLRALQHGKTIAMLEIKTSSFGIDTIEDYERALKSIN